MYYIGTGTQYIATKSNNSMYVTKNLDEARRYSTIQRATNALVTLPRKFYEISSSWGIREDVVEQPTEKNALGENTSDENNTDNTIAAPDVDYLGLLGSMADLNTTKNGCLSRLQGKLSELSEEITDIEHYIEFSKLNVSDAYRAYKMLRDTLQERRRIKDSITAAKALYENCDVKEIATTQRQLEDRSYKPRRLTGLFE